MRIKIPDDKTFIEVEPSDYFCEHCNKIQKVKRNKNGHTKLHICECGYRGFWTV